MTVAKVHDYLETLKGIEGDYPGTLIDDISAAYDEDIMGYEAAGAEYAAATEEMASLKARIAILEEQNHALILALPANFDSDGSDDEAEDSDSDSEDEDSNDGDSDDDGRDAIDRLFS